MIIDTTDHSDARRARFDDILVPQIVSFIAILLLGLFQDNRVVVVVVLVIFVDIVVTLAITVTVTVTKPSNPQV